MARQVTVNVDAVVLPDGNYYNAGETATLSDDEFDRIQPDAFDGSSPMLTAGAYQSDLQVTSPDGTVYRIVVADGGALSTEAV